MTAITPKKLRTADTLFACAMKAILQAVLSREMLYTAPLSYPRRAACAVSGVACMLEMQEMEEKGKSGPSEAAHMSGGGSIVMGSRLGRLRICKLPSRRPMSRRSSMARITVTGCGAVVVLFKTGMGPVMSKVRTMASE